MSLVVVQFWDSGRVQDVGRKNGENAQGKENSWNGANGSSHRSSEIEPNAVMSRPTRDRVTNAVEDRVDELGNALCCWATNRYPDRNSFHHLFGSPNQSANTGAP